MIEIITDSTCDIPDALIARHHINVLHHTIIWGHEQLRDRQDIQPEEFYERLERDPCLPSTAALSMIDFAQAYQAAQSNGASEIVAVVVNSVFSSTYQNALTAAEQVDIPVHVIDTLSTSMGLGWQALTAARLRDAGASSAEIVERVAEIRRKLYLYVGLDTLEFIEKGGRIGKAARLLGTLLQIKPIVDVSARTGEVTDIGTSRTRKRMIEDLYRRFFEVVDPTRPFRICVLHGKAPAEAAELIERIQREYQPLEILTNITTPVLGLNTGPRALGLTGYNE